MDDGTFHTEPGHHTPPPTPPEVDGVPTFPTAVVMQQVGIERQRQDAKWGVQDHPDFDPTITPRGTPELWGTCLQAALDRMENAKAECDKSHQEGRSNYLEILIEEVMEAQVEAIAGDEGKLRTELIQTAAVAIAWIEAIDRRVQKREGHRHAE